MTPRSILAFLALAIVLSSCVHKVKVQPQTGAGEFPAAIATIMQTKCATPGCHNQASYTNAAGLLLDNWTHLFQGGDEGAVVIPYSTTYSTLLYYVNTDPSKGYVYQPQMPVPPMAPLTAAEYNTLSTWIKNGAPDAQGNIAFAADSNTRQKSYLIHGDCDQIIIVIDSKTGLAMRVIPTADSTVRGSGHDVRFSPDGVYAYASVIYYKSLVKINASNDKALMSLDLSAAESLYGSSGANEWANMKLSPDGNSLVICDFDANGCALLINTQTMTVTQGWRSMTSPHAVTANATFDTFFATSANHGNTIYKFSRGYLKPFSVNELPPTTLAPSDGSTEPIPHDILMSPDFTKLFITCQGQNCIKVLDAYSMAVLDSVAIGAYPQDMAISLAQPYLFVTCKLDPATAGTLGSVYIINYKTLQVVKTIKDQFFAPHGVTVDDKDGLFYIASSNVTGSSHHVTLCGSPNGWYNAYYLNTLSPAFSNKSFAVFSDPYAMDTRFK